MNSKHTPIIEIKNLDTGYTLSAHRTKIVGKNLSASISSNEMICILGANGSGKSTLLRTICGFQQPLSGDILLNGKSLSTYSEKQLATIIAVVLTEKTDIKNLTVRQLISLGRSPYTGFFGNLSEHDKAVVQKVLQDIGIVSLADNFVTNLSDGEKQKVMIAKALAQDTPIIMLDEPTAFLDFGSKAEIMHLLSALARDMGKTIFLSTHDLEMALQTADKIWLIDKNRAITSGTPEDLSLNGKLTSFLDNEHVIFDEEKGLYNIHFQTSQQIHLTGSGRVHSMVRKALNRKGFEAAQHIQSPQMIEIIDDEIWFTTTDQKVRVESIEHLINIIDNQL